MSRNNINLQDPSPRSGVYEGDLKYGRALGTLPEKGKDFPADRHDGHASNLPIVPLKPAFKRNPALWSGRVKVCKRVANSPTIATEVMIAAQHYPNGLAAHLNPVSISRLLASF